MKASCALEGAFLVSLLGCARHPSTGLHPAAAQGIQVTLENGEHAVPLLNENFAEAPGAKPKDKVRIRADSTLGALAVTVRDIGADGSVKVLECKPTRESCLLDHAVLYDLGSSLEDLQNADQLHFIVTTTATGQQPTPRGEFAVNFHRRWSWTGLVVPVLYVVQGSASEFGLKNLAPSTGLGGQLNVDSKKFPYFALEGLFSLNPNAKPSTASDKPYSSGVGGVVDFGGWLQAGATYSTQGKRWSAILGVRETIWSRLTGK